MDIFNIIKGWKEQQKNCEYESKTGKMMTHDMSQLLQSNWMFLNSKWIHETCWDALESNAGLPLHWYAFFLSLKEKTWRPNVRWNNVEVWHRKRKNAAR